MDVPPIIDIGYEPKVKPLVLVVDDENIIQSLIFDCLDGWYRLVSAFNGREGLGKAINLKPDLILMDVMMPGISGLQLCNRLRAKKTIGRVPVLFLSGLSDEKDAVAAIAAGGDFFLGKPFEIAHLRRAVETLMGSQHRYPSDPIPASLDEDPTQRAA
jgi:DNA-binding response OmpR family regulator